MMNIIASAPMTTTVNIVASTTGPERFAVRLIAETISKMRAAIDKTMTPSSLQLNEAEYIGLRFHASHAPTALNRARAAVIMAYFGFSSVQLWLTGSTCPFGSYE